MASECTKESHELSENTCYRPAGSDIVSEAIDDGIVVLNLGDGSYFTLDGVARDVWTLLLSGRSRDEVTADLVCRYDAGRETVEKEVDSFLARLRDEGLVVPYEADGREVPWAPLGASGRLPFSPPLLVKYTDMEDLLNLDPIHEVDEAGWPVARPTDGR